MAAALLAGLKDRIKAAPKPQQPATHVTGWQIVTQEELRESREKRTADMPFELERAKAARANLIAQRDLKCSLYGYKLIRIEVELFNQAEGEYSLSLDRIEHEGKCAVWISPESYLKAQQKGWKMEVLIEDGQDAVDQKRELLIDARSKEIAALEYMISNKLPYTFMPATPENIQRRAEEEEVAQQERNKRCAEIKAKRSQQK